MRRYSMSAMVVAGSFFAAAAVGQTIVQNGSTPATVGPSANFIGHATIRMLTKSVAPGQVVTAIVAFDPGARTNWHVHPAGQTLYVLEGCGWTQVEGGPVEKICKGDTVYVRPGLKHWHGATRDTPMEHLVISESPDGKLATWGAPVTDGQYKGP